MNKVFKTALVGAAVAVTSFGLAQPALANSFSKNVGDGTISYTDSSDSFCVQAYNSEGARWVEVTLTPVNGGGPTRTVRDNNNYYGHSGSTCTSLATAYEDTYYRASVRTYWGENGSTVSRGNTYFYS
ncbi:hypothetical protein ACIBG7_20095 [Nonomuraea sp. NPDC050328]|uniref:hypothetical protein n=1 Tax=Nonomuraea sp. NPDC050328 TaxID=3364361 RepID=UPI0037BCC433